MTTELSVCASIQVLPKRSPTSQSWIPDEIEVDFDVRLPSRAISA